MLTLPSTTGFIPQDSTLRDAAFGNVVRKIELMQTHRLPVQYLLVFWIEAKGQ